jgi:hypothetical protein
MSLQLKARSYDRQQAMRWMSADRLEGLGHTLLPSTPHYNPIEKQLPFEPRIVPICGDDQSAAGAKGNPRHRRQLRDPQPSESTAMAGTASPLDLPLHANLGIMAQRRRGLLRQTLATTTQARRLPIRRRPSSRYRPLRRRDQQRSKTLHLDRQSKQNHRRCQPRAPNVRFVPLASDGESNQHPRVRVQTGGA